MKFMKKVLNGAPTRYSFCALGFKAVIDAAMSRWRLGERLHGVTAVGMSLPGFRSALECWNLFLALEHGRYDDFEGPGW